MEEPIYETDARRIARDRKANRIARYVIPIGAGVFVVAARVPWPAALLVAIVTMGVLAFSSSATVIGVGVYRDHLRIVTPAKEYSYPWYRVDVTVYRIFTRINRIDIQTPDTILPFMLHFGSKDQRKILTAIEKARAEAQG